MSTRGNWTFEAPGRPLSLKILRSRTCEMNQSFEVSGKALAVKGRAVVRVCSLRDEYYDFVEDPAAFLRDLKSDSRVKADLFTFTQPVPDPEPKFSYHLEYDSAAVVFLST